jgi:tetratricopeptide (TPR) repeat protein
VTPKAARAGLLAAAIAFGPAASAQDGPRNHAAWWITTYGAVDAAEDEVVARVHRVFERVAAVADKAVGRVPRLVVLRDTPTLAVALPDGTVLLSRAGVALAYKEVSTEAGDARLAFVLGHELRHLARDDFWHAFTAAALETAGGESPPASTTLRRDLKRSPSADRVREMHADSYGFLYAVMAGYPVDEAVAAGGAFLERWAAESATGPEERDSHPLPADRATLLAVTLREVQERLDLFHFGVRLLQLGRFEDALALLETFKEHFPSREVLGNIGVARFQLAVRALAACDPRLPVRFKLPTRIDPEALVAPARMRGPAPGPCASLAMVRERMSGAIDELQKAVEMDRGSRAGWTNLSSALILAGEYARAMDAAGKGLALGPDVALAGNAALAHYAYGVETRIAGLADAGQQEIERLARDNPDDATLAFNLGAVLAERGRTAGARDAWMRFLALEPEGPFAALAREQLGIAAVPPPRPPRVNAPPIPLGEPTEGARKSLAHLARRELDTGGLRGAVYRGAGLAVLELDGSVELVEVELAPPPPWDAVRGDWGPPIARMARPGGETLVYAGVAVDVADGHARRRIHFVP